jgi:hypothetical protein
MQCHISIADKDTQMYRGQGESSQSCRNPWRLPTPFNPQVKAMLGIRTHLRPSLRAAPVAVREGTAAQQSPQKGAAQMAALRVWRMPGAAPYSLRLEYPPHLPCQESGLLAARSCTEGTVHMQDDTPNNIITLVTPDNRNSWEQGNQHTYIYDM